MGCKRDGGEGYFQGAYNVIVEFNDICNKLQMDLKIYLIIFMLKNTVFKKSDNIQYKQKLMTDISLITKVHKAF